MERVLMASEILDAGMTRKQLAEEMDMSYQHLTNKMCGFSNWKDEELKRARHILSARIRKRSAVTA